MAVHRAASYLCRLFPANVRKVAVEAYVLSPSDAAHVSRFLPLDADDYYYSACLSVVDALRAIEAGFYTWSTVKMYYSVFYSLRAMLAWDNIALFRPVEAPFRVEGISGALPIWVDGKGSHKSMLNCFRRLRASHFLLSQPIGLSDGLGWLLEKREDANYAVPRFCEPEVPDHYQQILNLGVRQAVAAYLTPANSLLTFDEEHAIVSYPLAVLKAAGDAAKARGGSTVGESELAFLGKKCKERGAALAPLMTYIRGTIKI